MGQNLHTTPVDESWTPQQPIKHTCSHGGELRNDRFRRHGSWRAGDAPARWFRTCYKCTPFPKPIALGWKGWCSCGAPQGPPCFQTSANRNRRASPELPPPEQCKITPSLEIPTAATAQAKDSQKTQTISKYLGNECGITGGRMRVDAEPWRGGRTHAQKKEDNSPLPSERFGQCHVCCHTVSGGFHNATETQRGTVDGRFRNSGNPHKLACRVKHDAPSPRNSLQDASAEPHQLGWQTSLVFSKNRCCGSRRRGLGGLRNAPVPPAALAP